MSLVRVALDLSADNERLLRNLERSMGALQQQSKATSSIVCPLSAEVRLTATALATAVGADGGQGVLGAAVEELTRLVAAVEEERGRLERASATEATLRAVALTAGVV